MINENDITRFVEAQEAKWMGYDWALGELVNGKKISHWIWYIFPQLRGLGSSHRSHYYGITDRKEAEDYLAHPILGSRLREITLDFLKHTDKSAVDILGDIDDQKVQSCMTLFDCISPNDIYGKVLIQFYDGQRDLNSIV